MVPGAVVTTPGTIPVCLTSGKGRPQSIPSACGSGFFTLATADQQCTATQETSGQQQRHRNGGAGLGQ